MLHRDFTKVLPCEGYDFGVPAVSLIKSSQRGLVGQDRRDFLKRAGHDFASQFDKVALHPGDVAAHLLIVGATEYYGPNRNKDGFTKASCEKFHPTFVKYAKCYRNHINKDPLRSYGYVKLSHYNPTMNRIELLAIYNGTKEAADRNGGLVADKELEDLEADGEFPTSMACTLPFDHCSHCGNPARNRGEYCRGVHEGGQCKAGGLMHNIGAITDDPANPILHADNREKVCFFDASRVGRQADLIAYALGITKKAASLRDLDGASLAQELGVLAPLETIVDDEDIARLIKVGRHAASIEKLTENTASNWAIAFQNRPEISHWRLEGTVKFADAARALADAGMVLPVEGFLALIAKPHTKIASDLVERVRGRVPGSIARLLDDQKTFVSLAESGVFHPAAVPTKQADYLLHGAESCVVTKPVAARHRLVSAMLDGHSPRPLSKQAAAEDDLAAELLARAYAFYKLAFLDYVQNSCDFPWTTRLCIVQN